MQTVCEIVTECASYREEQNWFEFKNSWYESDGIGEYISALSNAAAMLGRDEAYLIWGMLFNKEAFTEAVINAFVHNQWVNGDSPMFTAYEDRVEIVSIGTMPPGQTKEGFFSGVSVPANKKLSEIFLQLHISEKSGRGVPRIVKEYGHDVFGFWDNAIAVSIPFDRLNLGGSNSMIPPVTPPVIPLDEVNSVQYKIVELCIFPRGISEIMKELGYKDKKTVRKYLNPLIEQGRVARTIPDKPNSKNQKYITIK